MDELLKVRIATVIGYHYETNFASVTKCKCGWSGSFQDWPIHLAEAIIETLN